MNNNDHYYRIDDNIYSAVKLYFLYGLNPGSFVEQVIRGNPQAVNWAHPQIKQEDYQEAIRDLIRELPDCCLGENFDIWKGIVPLNSNWHTEELDNLKVFIKMSMSKDSLLMSWIKWHEGMEEIKKPG